MKKFFAAGDESQIKKVGVFQVEDDKTIEEALPELQLVELQKSEKAINKVEGRESEVEAVRPWNNYTIVIIKDSDEIKIFDEDARRLESFQAPLNSKTIKVEWGSKELQKKIGSQYRYIANDPQYANTSSNLMIDNAPPELRPFAKKNLANYVGYFTINEQSPTRLSVSDAAVLDKYIIFFTKEGGYFAFETQNENGIVLAPRNWKRIGPADVIPENLSKYAEKILGKNEGFKQLNDKYSALITDVGINIVKNEEAKGVPLFADRIPSIERNVTVDPKNPNIIYYCQSSNPRGVIKLDLSAESNAWDPVSAEFLQKYESVNNLQLDPSGNFFLFYSNEDLVIVTKDGLEEVKRVPNLTQVNFDGQGRIRAVDKDGRLVIYEPNFNEFAQALDKRRIARLAAGIKVADIFDESAEKKKKNENQSEALEYLLPLRNQYSQEFNQVLAQATTPESVRQLRSGFNRMRDTLKQQGLKSSEVSFILEGLDAPIITKEKEFALKDAQESLTRVRSSLIGGLSVASVSEARATIDSLKAIEGLLDQTLRQEVRAVALELEQKSLELFRQRGGEIIKDVNGLLERTKTDLEAFTSKAQMDDWLEFRYPQLKARLGFLAHDCPLEADEAYKAITGARNNLQQLANSFEEKFKREYAKVREKAVERIEAVVDTLESDISGLIDRLRSKGFADRGSAEDYLNTSEAKKTLEAEIAALSTQNPDVAKELDRAVKVRLSNVLTEIERGALTQVAQTGQQMVMFGEVAFPKWEAKVKEKSDRKVDVLFDEDAKTHGPGVGAKDIFGDVALAIKNPDGSIAKVRLYEDFYNENEWRLGLLNYRGEAIPPSYLNAAEFKTVKKEYGDWAMGEKSKLRSEMEQLRSGLKEIYSERQKIGERTVEVDDAWKTKYSEKLKEYATFCAEHHIALFNHIDRIKNEAEIENSNGKGFVPEWQSHWVADPQTEKDLQDMAETFKMQLDLQEGILNLKGHAGTGKDVRIKMFAALTHRPYFGIDCTKWTTEFELSEDVMLESADGASQTVKVPSAVLNGITTPGAIVYFNEFTAMPEQAQIFLHALLDEKRSLTLKTSSGKTVRALPSTLLVSSMNPDYPGTFAPQFATRSRMVSLDIDYPPSTRKPDAKDSNRNLLFDASEALRIARGVDSLADLTYEANVDRNEFVKMWDKYVNGIENGAANPVGTQKFDVDTILALVQFANNLRENFIKIFEKSRESRNALPVTQPITGRELRRCAYALSKMTPEEKAIANSEVIARQLLDKYFLTHIDKKEEKDKIKTALNTWTSKKRVKA